MANSKEITKNMDRLFEQVQENLNSYYSRDDFEQALAQYDHAPKSTKKFRLEDLHQLCEARGLNKQGIDEYKLVENRELLDMIPDREEIKTELLDAFYNMYLSFPKNTDYMERLVYRLAPEYQKEPVRVVILKKFLLGSSPSFKRYRTAMPLEWAQQRLTPEEKEILDSLPEEKKRAFLVSKITDELFVQHLSEVDTNKLSSAEMLRFIVRRVENYQARLAPLAEQVNYLETLLKQEEIPAFDALSREKRQELLQERVQNASLKNTACLEEDVLSGLVLLMEGLHANGLRQLSLEDLELAPETLQQLDGFLTQQGVKAEPSALGRVQQCAEAAEQAAPLNQEMEQQLKQLLKGVEEDLRKQLKKIPRVSRTGALGDMASIYMQDKKDADAAKAADSELLNLCNDLACANFRGNGKTRMALYHFALMFGMTFAPDGSGDRERDIEINLFQDFYSDNLLRALDPAFSHSKTVEQEPTGEGINYKSFVECVYLYYLYHTELDLTPGERIDAAENVIVACVRKATALEKEAQKKARPSHLLSAADDGTLIYKEKFSRELLEKKPPQLVEFILKNYLVLSPAAAGLHRIMIASEENTAQALADDYMTEQDFESYSVSDLDIKDDIECADQTWNHCIEDDLSANSGSFQWNLCSQLKEYSADEDFQRVVAALDDRVRSKTGRYSLNMRYLMVELLHVLASQTVPGEMMLQSKIEKKFSPAVKQILEFEKEKRKKEKEESGAVSADTDGAVTVLNAWKLLVEIGYDIPRMKGILCSPKQGETAKERADRLKQQERQLKKMGYTVQRVQTDRGEELRGFIPYKKGSDGPQKKEVELLEKLGGKVQETSAFCLGSREYQSPELASFLKRVSGRYIAEMDEVAISLASIMSHRLMKRITRSELMILHFHYYIATIDPENWGSFANVYEEYSKEINKLLEKARFQPLSSKNILDMYLVGELYLYLLDNNEYLSPLL